MYRIEFFPRNKKNFFYFQNHVTRVTFLILRHFQMLHLHPARTKVF